MDHGTVEYRLRRDMDLLRASAGLGSCPDASRIAQTLATLLVADFADMAMVDVAQAVAEGGELADVTYFGQLGLRRLGAAAHAGEWPSGPPGAGADTPVVPDSPALEELRSGRAVLINDLDLLKATLDDDSGLVQAVLPEGARSGLSVALYARSLLLSGITVWRLGPTATWFDADDATLIEQIAALAALSLDNSRRSVREEQAAATLQSSLLPPTQFEDTTAETVGMYVSADPGSGVGGDWFDVVPLPSLRTAFVIGDVVGHGIHAAATMGRLRTAVQTLADLELEPDELLTRLDDLVRRMAGQYTDASGPRGEVLGTTCLYAVYDPAQRRCTLASAGHPPPALVEQGGRARMVDVAPGPPLGVGGLPFEPCEIELEPGSVLAFYTDGLIGFPSADIGVGMDRLRHLLDETTQAGVSLYDTARHVVDQLITTPGKDDATALFVRTRGVSGEDMAVWQFPAEPSVVAEARERTVRQLADWHLDDLAFTTELVVSELVTNAVRYADGPVGVRLIRDRALVCEVSDPSNTQPRLRRAQAADEGGRGLFLVAQLTDRWGSRYTRSGKTIWTEQLLPPPR
ncbi:ATP-binding SpoIIE family protein phosphatase [Streptomyces sp. NPDC046909]|uniref:ATP-binding SpoIIE family protein phosphatase n=1 Tax=Streptomyces sp. NPDC046909 TaxID=3155617 RepID=UPI0033C70A69